jgi:hypothetical protein
MECDIGERALLMRVFIAISEADLRVGWPTQSCTPYSMRPIQNDARTR